MIFRFPGFNSLKIGILIYLTLLIASAMLLINIVMIKLAEQDLVKKKLDAARTVLCYMDQKVKDWILIHGTWSDFQEDYNSISNMQQLLCIEAFDGALFVDDKGKKVLEIGQCGKQEFPALSLARQTLRMKRGRPIFSGKTWGVIWPSPEYFRISTPLILSGKLTGAITLCGSFRDIYEELRETEKIVLLYILLNAVILITVGGYLISRTVLKPIKRLLRATENFSEGDFLPDLAGSSWNEIGQLSRSLNMMLRRLEENKRELETHVSSLRKANRELQTAQKEIIRTEKMASVGRLTAGIAHEIGNPITIILGYLELLRTNEWDRTETRDFLKRIESEIDRIRHIIKQLVDFSRPSGSEQNEINIHDLLMETVEIAKPRLTKYRIGLDLKLEAARDVACVDPNQLRQVFLNIVMNALDAMKEVKGDNMLMIRSCNRKDHLEIRFTDTGPGIPADELAHIFDPFYTTKEEGKGPGLGLWICHSIMDGLGGTIRAESPPGEGVTVVVDLAVISV